VRGKKGGVIGGGNCDANKKRACIGRGESRRDVSGGKRIVATQDARAETGVAGGDVLGGGGEKHPRLRTRLGGKDTVLLVLDGRPRRWRNFPLLKREKINENTWPGGEPSR